MTQDKLALLGGTPAIQTAFTPFNTIGEEELAAATEVIRSGVLSGYIGAPGEAFMGGPKVRAFEATADAYFGVKHAIDIGVVPGPRIYPSGAMITVTSGHGDFRQLFELPRSPGKLSRIEQIGGAAIVDSPDEMRMRVREQLMLGEVTGDRVDEKLLDSVFSRFCVGK